MKYWVIKICKNYCSVISISDPQISFNRLVCAKKWQKWDQKLLGPSRLAMHFLNLLIITSGYPIWYCCCWSRFHFPGWKCMTAQNPHCGELWWKKSSDDFTHQLIAQRQVDPVSLYYDGVGRHVLCLQHGILQVGSTLIKVPLIQAGTVLILSQLFKIDVLAQQTNTWSCWPVAIKDDRGMLRRALAKVEPHPTTREKLLTKLQIRWAQISQRAIQKRFRSTRRLRECTAKRDGHAHYWYHLSFFFMHPYLIELFCGSCLNMTLNHFLCVFVSQYSKLY